MSYLTVHCDKIRSSVLKTSFIFFRNPLKEKIETKNSNCFVERLTHRRRKKENPTT